MADATIILTDDAEIPGKFNLTVSYSGDFDENSTAHNIAFQLMSAVIDAHPVEGEPEQEPEPSRLILPQQGVIHGL